jgi:hypothetical protein
MHGFCTFGTVGHNFRAREPQTEIVLRDCQKAASQGRLLMRILPDKIHLAFGCGPCPISRNSVMWLLQRLPHAQTENFHLWKHVWEELQGKYVECPTGDVLSFVNSRIGVSDFQTVSFAGLVYNFFTHAFSHQGSKLPSPGAIVFEDLLAARLDLVRSFSRCQQRANPHPILIVCPSHYVEFWKDGLRGVSLVTVMGGNSTALVAHRTSLSQSTVFWDLWGLTLPFALLGFFNEARCSFLFCKGGVASMPYFPAFLCSFFGYTKENVRASPYLARGLLAWGTRKRYKKFRKIPAPSWSVLETKSHVVTEMACRAFATLQSGCKSGITQLFRVFSELQTQETYEIPHSDMMERFVDADTSKWDSKLLDKFPKYKCVPKCDPSAKVIPTQECSICTEALSQTLVMPCGHLFCYPCIIQLITTNSSSPFLCQFLCPLCQQTVKIEQVRAYLHRDGKLRQEQFQVKKPAVMKQLERLSGDDKHQLRVLVITPTASSLQALSQAVKELKHPPRVFTTNVRGSHRYRTVPEPGVIMLGVTFEDLQMSCQLFIPHRCVITGFNFEGPWQPFWVRQRLHELACALSERTPFQCQMLVSHPVEKAFLQAAYEKPTEKWTEMEWFLVLRTDT